MAKQKELTRAERFKSYEHVFDHGTLRGLFKLSSQGYFDELKSPIKMGKEASVFSATKDDGLVCVKIYRIAANFKKMFDYMAADSRYVGLKKNKMAIIYAWARKEYRNLLRARSSGVKVPKPIAVFKNILVMEMIGNNGAAPQLNNSYPKDPKKFYENLISNVKKLYQDANLIHGDLSAFNILNDNQTPVMIDMSHAVDFQYPNNKELLERDIKIIVNYFNKFNLKIDYKKEVEKCIHKK
ncbi:MAG: serine protein kinase RIO [Nanoarchaeota archaeon]|nr:serine protein kinase RIO [Nanoarchaeota archaeon]MBU4352359.1 serine protein kinase RIO [Nanoarchaeota archaeon]MBU4456270.1 serine protein kinase RIO [Nanoarchaeota archaeon]MCG2720385.1 serine protein kinase RIO [Nanoarchaeota archaeon]